MQPTAPLFRSIRRLALIAGDKLRQDPRSGVLLIFGSRRRAIEVYPHPAMVGLWVMIVQSRSGGRALTTASVVVPPSRITAMPGLINARARSATRRLLRRPSRI